MSSLREVRASLRQPRSAEVRGPPRDDLEMIERAEQTLQMLHGKWKVHLLFLMARGIHRHSALLGHLPGTSKKVMTDTLRALERDGLVNRTVFAEVPARVEYSLTSLGWTITEPLMGLADWAEAHGDGVEQAQDRRRMPEGGPLLVETRDLGR
jgi:DNA-binding HxlR family transcriptional regulator